MTCPRAIELIGVFLLLAGTATSQEETWDTYSDTWTATDDLGRVLPGHAETGAANKDRTVGLFYYIWHGPHGYGNRGDGEMDRAGQGVMTPKTDQSHLSPHNIEQILKSPPEERKWGRLHSFHHWGEPLIGYYVANDEWVIRKHAQMMADAGIDVVLFDVTNGYTYRDVYRHICRIYEDIRSNGGRTPQVAFNCGTLENANKRSVPALYSDFYSRGLHKDLWFMWKGKPLLLANFTVLDAQYTAFFNIRYSWAWTRSINRRTGKETPLKWWENGRDRWPWLDKYPQNFGWHEDPKVPEQIVVATAEHPLNDIGKSFHNGASPRPLQTAQGLYFAEQWSRALQVNPEFLLITQWNEWVAQRFLVKDEGTPRKMAGEPLETGDSYFVDCLNSEYNRDIEPMMGGYGDNFYYQMINGIRRYKGTRPVPAAGTPVTIAKFEDWDKVTPEFRDDRFDTSHRNHFGWGRIGPLANTTGRNDIVTAKVSRDAENLYFLVSARKPLTPGIGENWMELFLALDGLPKDALSWEGYHCRLHLDQNDKNAYVIERSLGGWKWRQLGKCSLKQDAYNLMLTVPRTYLGPNYAGDEFSLRFKWSDNRQTKNAIDWLQHGDAAPNARFQYRYRTEASTTP